MKKIFLLMAALLCLSEHVMGQDDESDHVKHYRGADIPSGVVYNFKRTIDAMKNPNFVNDGDTSAYEQAVDICDEFNRQASAQSIDEVSLARLLMRKEQESDNQLEAKFELDYALMTQREKEECDREMTKLRKRMTHSRTNWVKIANKHPGLIVESLTRSCQQLKEGGMSNIGPTPVPRKHTAKLKRRES